MASTVSLQQHASEPQPKRINSSDVMKEAIGRKDIEHAKTLLTKENRKKRTKMFFHDWCTCIADVQNFENRLQNEFLQVLFEISFDDIPQHLSNALSETEENTEGLALEILTRRPDLAKYTHKDDRTSLDIAVQEGRAQVVEKILDLAQENCYWNLVNPRKDGKGDTIRFEEKAPTTSTLEKAAKSGHLQIVKLLIERDKSLLDVGYPLHCAVRGVHKDVVEYLIAQKDDLIERFTPAPESRSALFANQALNEKSESKEIKKILVDKIVRGGRKSPALVKKLLKGPQDQHTEVCLDLSVFSRTNHNFSALVDGLVRDKQLFEVRFQPILLYVQFPSLNATKTIGEEAAKILQWLRRKKNVTEIIQLRVPSSIPRMEREEYVEEALEGISVDLLDWRVLDLSIDILLKCDAKCVEVLSLYSSGNWGVLQQWSGDEGVKRLKKLKHLEITIINSSISEHRAKKCLDGLRHRLTDETHGTLKDRQITTNFTIGSWKSSESSLRSTVGLDPLRDTLTITKLKKFLNFYLSCDKAKSPPTRVAVIDNGVDGTLSTLSERIIDGLSLVEDFDGHESPWWLPSHPHGTQMASFVHQLDPCCGLYIVKVCDEFGGIEADTVAEAITRAVEKNVDIITMSHTLPKTTEKLRKAVSLAKDNDIVMFSSRGDRGANRESVWPAEHGEVISISSLTTFGTRGISTETNAKYFFQGENVSIPTEPSYLESGQMASGSSVATALAAGVAALILSCRRLIDKSQRMDRVKTVTKVFDQMTAGDSDKYVKPWEFFKDKSMDEEEGRMWLNGKFGETGDFYFDRPS